MNSPDPAPSRRMTCLLSCGIHQDPTQPSPASGRRLRPPVHPATGPRPPRVHRPPVRPGRAGRRPGLAARRGRGHRRGPGQERPVRRGTPRLPAPAGRGRPRPRRPDPRPGDEPPGPLQQGLAPAPGSLSPSSARCWPTPTASTTRPTTTTGSCSGCKGIMSEAELHILRGRMYQGRLNKARRGELFSHAADRLRPAARRRVGPRPRRAGAGVVRLIFDQFDRQGSLHGLLRYLVQHGIRIPVRPHGGPNRGQLEWRRPNRETLQNLLHHPIYAGLYRYGHRTVDPRKQQPGPAGHRPHGRAPGAVPGAAPRPLPGLHHVGTVRGQPGAAGRQPRTRPTRRRAPRSGPSLLGGLVGCGRCGRRMMIGYASGGQGLRYSLQPRRRSTTPSRCARAWRGGCWTSWSPGRSWRPWSRRRWS